MPPLGRSGRLLRTVNNKPHATQADHHDALPTPPATNSTRSSGSVSKVVEDEEDINRSPETSDDERARAPFRQPPITDGATDQHATTKFEEARSYMPPSPRAKKAQWRGAPSLNSPESSRSKRTRDSNEQGSSDVDKPIFSPQGSLPKKQKTTTTANIHTAPAPRKPRAHYGRKGSQRSQASSQSNKFKEATKPKKKDEEPAQATFKLAKIEDDVFQFQGDQASAQFNAPGEGHGNGRSSLSPSTSSLSSIPDSPEVEEVPKFDLPPKRFIATCNCNICGDTVELMLKEDFQNKYTDGKPMSFKWQQRFCRHHKHASAQQSYSEKGYPEIDWAGLEKRMRRFDKHLRDVICNRVDSEWKHDLGRYVRPSKSKDTANEAVEDAQKVRSTAWTGYYGPRGEKAMTEHIVAHLSNDLRQHASKDKMVAASGKKGGLSGFVHGVLVPELACQLVAEDLGITVEKAKVTVEESQDEGILLYPEVEEDVGAGARGG